MTMDVNCDLAHPHVLNNEVLKRNTHEIMKVLALALERERV